MRVRVIGRLGERWVGESVVLMLLVSVRHVDRDGALLLLPEFLAPVQCALLGVEPGTAEAGAEVGAARDNAPAAPVDVDREAQWTWRC
jgi:hypothetical protein